MAKRKYTKTNAVGVEEEFVEKADEKPDPKIADDEALLKKAREGLDRCADSESSQRAIMRDDLRFATLDQWPADIRASREDDPNGMRPCLTSDEINQYISQVENDMRHNRPSIKPRPVDDKGDVETAEIFAGLIRHIEDQSNAEVAYVTAGGSAVKIGLGYFRVVTEYVEGGGFKDQEPRIVRIPNTFSVYLGPHISPDGSDATEAWVVEEMPIERFKREFPKAKCEPSAFDSIGDTSNWKTDQTVTVCEHFYIEHTKKTLLFLADGSTVDADKYDGPQDNIQDERESFDKKVKWIKMTAVEILDRGDWLGKYIPIIEVVGKEQYVDGKRNCWGLVRPAKDMLRMKNYWISAATEKIALSPKTPFIAAVGQLKTDLESWRKANVENQAVLQYDAIEVNGNVVPPPKRVEPAPVEMAIVNMLGMIEHDVQKSLGMFKASLGESQSQQSGKAILALEKSSDIGTYHFQDNLSLSIKHCGRILIDIIPKVIDTRRVLRIVGEDGESKSVTVDPQQQGSIVQGQDSLGKIRKIYNLGAGVYDVTVTTGPSYSTARQEAAAIFTDLANSAKEPAAGAVYGYLAIKNSDFHGATETMKMLKALLPPQVLQAIQSDEPIPPQAMAKIMELTQHTQAMQQQGQELQQENMQLKSGAQVSMAKVQADAQAAEVEHALQKQKQDGEAQLAREKAKADFELKQYIAENELALASMKCDHEKTMASDKMTFEQESKRAAFASAENDKIEAKNEAAKADVLPVIVEQLQQAFGQIGELLQQSIVLQQQTLAAIQAPKKVSIGSIQKDANGTPVGATVVSTPTNSQGHTVQ